MQALESFTKWFRAVHDFNNEREGTKMALIMILLYKIWGIVFKANKCESE